MVYGKLTRRARSFSRSCSALISTLKISRTASVRLPGRLGFDGPASGLAMLELLLRFSVLPTRVPLFEDVAGGLGGGAMPWAWRKSDRKCRSTPEATVKHLTAHLKAYIWKQNRHGTQSGWTRAPSAFSLEFLFSLVLILRQIEVKNTLHEQNGQLNIHLRDAGFDSFLRSLWYHSSFRNTYIMHRQQLHLLATPLPCPDFDCNTPNSSCMCQVDRDLIVVWYRFREFLYQTGRGGTHQPVGLGKTQKSGKWWGSVGIGQQSLLLEEKWPGGLWYHHPFSLWIGYVYCK